MGQTATGRASAKLNKYGLALHTSSPELGLAISNFASDSRERTWELGRSLSTHLHQYLAEFIQPQTWVDLDFVAVARGPGSFTGTRIGVVTARTLAQQMDIPLFAISTLATVAWSQQTNQEACNTFAVELPAQRGQVFAAIYQINQSGLGLTELLPDTAIAPEVWQQTLANLATPYQLISAPSDLGGTVSSLLELANLDWQQGKRPDWADALPYYGQHPVNR